MTPSPLRCLALLALIVSAGDLPAQPFERPHTFTDNFRFGRPKILLPAEIEALPAGVRDPVAKVVQSATLSAHGPAEECPANRYEWLCDHPDHCARAWRRLGVQCIPVEARDGGKFGWSDGSGAELVWWTTARGDGYRVWYAEGQGRPGPMLPMVPVKAVAVLRAKVHLNVAGRPIVTQDVDVYVQTDSKAAALVTKMLGSAAPRMAEQGAQQLLLFFGGLARYCDVHPDEADKLLR